MKTTKELIVEKSLIIFAENGYEGTCMEEIACQVGIKKASLYCHFSGKEEIFKTVFSNIISEYQIFVEGLFNDLKSGSIKECLKEIFKSYIMYNKRTTGMNFWDRFYYFPPKEFKDYIYKITSESKADFERKLEELFTAGINSNEIKNRKLTCLVSSYYYLLIGLTLSVTMFDEETLLKEIDKAICMFLEII